MSMEPDPRSPEFRRGLEEAEPTFRHLVEGIPAVVYIDDVDEVSTNLYTSPQVARIVGYSPEEWKANPNLWFDNLHPDDRERVMEINRRGNETGEPFSAEYRMIAKDGREVWIRDEAFLVCDREGEPLFWRGIMYDISEQKRVEEKLRRSLDILRRTMDERRELLYRLESAQEEERRRIAADIHDDSIQVMSAVDMRLQMLASTVGDAALVAELDEIHRNATQAVERLRHLLFELRPPTLDRDGLAAAVKLYLKQSARDAGLEFQIEDRLETEPPPEVRVALFRTAQEAITNVRKHAGARNVWVLLETVEDGVRVRVSDDGVGFDAREALRPEPGHLGLPAIIERAELAGGWCRVDSSPGGGTTIECWLPFRDAAPLDEAVSLG